MARASDIAEVCTSPAAAVLAEVFDLLPVGLVMLDGQLNTLHCNRAAGGVFGPADDWLGGWSARAASPDGRGWPEVFADALAGESAVRYETVRCAEADGAPRTFHLHLVPFVREAERALLVIFTDITREDELSQRLAATENLATVGRLAARVAHELNNPLDGTLRYVGLAARLLDKAGGTSDADAATRIHEYLDHVRDGLLRMTRIVADLLEFSRNAPVLRESGNINRVVEEALQALAHLADANRVTVLADFHDDNRMPTLADTRLYQVCCNLVRNAIDAMPGGGQLTVRTGIVESDVIVRIADTGVGLPDKVDNVFEPFYTSKPPGKGTGLGLAICREFIGQLGGRISAENLRDGGAVFTVRIPVENCRASDHADQTYRERT